MLPNLSLNSPSQPKDFPIPKPISLDEIKDSIPQRLDELKFGCFHIKIMLIASFILITQGFEMGYIFLTQHSYASASYMQLISYNYISKTSFIAGQIFGTFLFSLLTIYKGRLTSSRVLIILYCFGAFSSYFTHNQEKDVYDLIIYSLLTCIRFFIGIILGGFNVSILSIIGEVMPKNHRGQVHFFLISVCIPIGLIIYILSITIFHYYFSASGNIINLNRLIPLIFIFPLLFMTNSGLFSPRWEIYIGKFRDALDMMNEIDNTKTRDKSMIKFNNNPFQS